MCRPYVYFLVLFVLILGKSLLSGPTYDSGLTYYPLALEKAKEVWMTKHLCSDTSWNTVLDHNSCSQNFDLSIYYAPFPNMVKYITLKIINLEKVDVAPGKQNLFSVSSDANKGTTIVKTKEKNGVFLIQFQALRKSVCRKINQTISCKTQQNS
ncbi:MAG: hypothetical protein AB7E36_08230 [Salinivirgaceae bacterium]